MRHREPIFRSNKDRELFLETLGQSCEKTDWQVHAWCLMRNHFQFERRMELRRAAEDGQEFAPLERGWCVGSEEFRKELLAQMNAGPEHYGQEIRESAEEKARRRVKDELKKLGWSESELRERPKGDLEKLRIARALRQETTMTLGWIAQALHMGAKTHLSHLLYWEGKEKKKKRC